MAKVTIAEARQKYSQKCYELGDLEFKLGKLPDEIATMRTQVDAAFKELVKATQEEQKKQDTPEKIEIQTPEASQ